MDKSQEGQKTPVLPKLEIFVKLVASKLKKIILENHEENQKYTTLGRVNLDKLHQEQAELKAAQKASQIDPKQNVFNAMSMFSTAIDFGISLALPLLGAVFLGNWLNQKYNSKYFVLYLIPIAITVSIISIYKQIKKLQDNLKKKK